MNDLHPAKLPVSFPKVVIVLSSYIDFSCTPTSVYILISGMKFNLNTFLRQDGDLILIELLESALKQGLLFLQLAKILSGEILQESHSLYLISFYYFTTYLFCISALPACSTSKGEIQMFNYEK